LQCGNTGTTTEYGTMMLYLAACFVFEVGCCTVGTVGKCFGMFRIIRRRTTRYWYVRCTVSIPVSSLEFRLMMREERGEEDKRGLGLKE
jgi:hypothetical protein